MGNVSAYAGAQTALGAALASNAALTAAGSASALAGANFGLNATAMAGLTALANGIGALQLGLKMPLSGSNCAPSLEQLANALQSAALFKALGGLPMSSLAPLQALAQLSAAMAASNALGVGLLNANAAAQLNAMAQANAAGSASGAASANAQAAINAAAYAAMSMSLQANLGIAIGAPGGVDMLGAKLNTLSSNAGALDALNGLLNAALLAQTLALLNALSGIKTSLGVNMLAPGAGLQVQPKLKSLSKSFAPPPSASKSKSVAKSLSKSKNASQVKALSKSAQTAQQGGLANLLTSLPVLPPATLLLAYLFDKLLGQLGVGLLQTSPCGPLCLVPSPPCPFGPADFAQEIAAEGAKLQAPKLAFEASATASTPQPPGAGDALALEVASSAPPALAASVGEKPTVKLGNAPSSKLGAASPAPPAPGVGTQSLPKPTLGAKMPPFPKGPKTGDGGASP